MYLGFFVHKIGKLCVFVRQMLYKIRYGKTDPKISARVAATRNIFTMLFGLNNFFIFFFKGFPFFFSTFLFLPI